LNPSAGNTRATELFETPIHLIKSEQFILQNPFQSGKHKKRVENICR